MTFSDVDIEAAAEGLRGAAIEATPAWTRRSILGIVGEQGLEPPENFEDLVDAAGRRAAEFVDQRMSALLRTDIDRQTTTPLSIFRDAVRFPVEVLHQLGARQVHRIDVSRWAFPNDPFGITPANLGDIGEEVHTAGIVWGATKAGLHLQRRKEQEQA